MSTEIAKSEIPKTDTEISTPKKRTVIACKVRVDLPTPNDNETQARIVSKDGKIDMRVSAALVLRRLVPAVQRSYFRAELEDDGIVNLCDRIVDEDW